MTIPEESIIDQSTINIKHRNKTLTSNKNK